MKIAIIGYGQMGKLLESLAAANDIEVVAIIDPKLNNEISAETISEADVCIDFTLPSTAVDNAEKIAKLGKNLVIGTTGWLSELPKIREIATENKVGIIYGSNFSVGMNTFFHIVENAAKLANSLDKYDLFGYELHHNKKQDSPSGTAKTLTDIVLKNINRKEQAQFDKLDRKIQENEFHFASIRSGNIPGTHVIGFDSTADTIELKHTARNREGFAIGALKAANWINNKQGIYDFKNIFFEMLMAK